MRRLDDFAQRRINPVLAPGEIGDALTVRDCSDQAGGD